MYRLLGQQVIAKTGDSSQKNMITETNRHDLQVFQVDKHNLFGLRKGRNTEKQLFIIVYFFELQRGSVSCEINAGLGVDDERVFPLAKGVAWERVRGGGTGDLTFQGHL